MELREENMVDKNDNNFDNPNDILALLQDYSDEDFTSNDLKEPNNMGKSLIDDMDLDNTDDDLLAMLDMIAEQDQTESAENKVFALDETEQTENEDTTFEEDNSNDDILALSDLWDDDLDISFDESFQEDSNYGDSSYEESSNLGDIFSDVLSAVSLEKENDTSRLNGQALKAADELLTTKEAVNVPKKKGIFSKLFKDDKESTADLETQNIKENKAEKKKDTKKKNASTKAIEKTKKQSSVEAKKEKKKAASSKKEKKAIEKKPAKPKKIKNKTGEKIIKEVLETESVAKPINKKLLVALSVMMISFGILIVFGTRAYTEALSVENATTNFERRRYTEAYNELYGASRNSKNKEIYDKVMTVMYVNKHLNTYNNFYSLELYPEALDSLIKGLQRYEQYIDRAIDLGVESDFNYIKDNILKELDGKFDVREEKAIKLSKVEDKIKYSKYVYSIADSKK
jgi:chemotaxis protein histidine kinase CheA